MKKLIILLFLLTPSFVSAEQPTILINEVAWMGTVTSSNDEWIELKNNTDADIDLTTWRLEAVDGTPEINLEGIVSANSYFLLERTDDDTLPEITADQIYTGSLSNSGEWLKLFDSEGNLVDEINASEAWPSGDNSTKQTLERNNSSSWQTSTEAGGTPKTENGNQEQPIENPTEDPTPDESTEQSTKQNSTVADSKAKKGDILITELFPDPAGIDINDEFIELKNVSSSDIDLTSWTIKNSAKQIFTLPSLKMTPNSIVIFYRHQTNLMLNNSKDKITLYNISGQIIDQVDYKSTLEAKSYQRTSDNKFEWSEISPGKNNVFNDEALPTAVINGPIQAEVGQIITFDASDSFDPESRELNYQWNFGDGRIATGITARQIYLQPGNYEISLTTVASQTASSTEKLKIKITGKQTTELIQSTSTPTTTKEIFSIEPIPFIFISEFLPDPEGLDNDNEFIEIFNNEETPINLTDWQLDDAEGGSRPYKIPEGAIIKPGQYLAFFRTETKLALNNSNDAVRLLTPSGQIVDLAEYEDTKQNFSFVLDENFSWHQTDTPTPGEINFLNEEKNEAEEKTKTPQVLGTSTPEIIENDEPKNKKKYIISGISALAILGLGAILKLKKM